MTENHGQTINILLVEDDDEDAAAFRHALEAKDIANPLFRARDASEALDMLRGARGATRVRRPYLIVLDLAMPRMNGHEFLDAIQADPDLSDSVVLVLAASEDDGDVAEVHRRNVAGRVVKGKAGDSFARTVDRLEQFWSLVDIPKNDG